MQGDALDVQSWLDLMQGVGSSVGPGPCDVLITDPPYCRLVRRRKHGDERDASPRARRRKLPDDPTTLRFESLAQYSAFTAAWLSLALQHGLKPGAPLVIWSNPLGRAAIIHALQPWAYVLEAEFLWAKRPLRPKRAPSAASAGSATVVASDEGGPPVAETLLRLHESALIFRHVSRPGLAAADDWSAPRSAITATPQHAHPCHKPLAAVAPLVHYHSRPGEAVLDCFAGSGAVLRACARLGRRGVGMEVLAAWAERGARLDDKGEEGEEGEEEKEED